MVLFSINLYPYISDVKILNGLKWTAALDKVFAENYKNDPEILWQYFGSQTGFMRTLPGKYMIQYLYFKGLIIHRCVLMRNTAHLMV